MMLKQLEIVKQRFIDIENQLQDMTIVSDHHKLRELSQARSELEPVVKAYEIQKTFYSSCPKLSRFSPINLLIVN